VLSAVKMAQSRKTAPVVKNNTAPKSVMSSVLQDTGRVLPSFFYQAHLHGLILFILAILLYANTLNHDFVLDDGIVITENKLVQQGIKGVPGILSKDTFFGFVQAEGREQVVAGGRYRPLSLILFAVLHQLVGNTAWVFHLLTVLLFAVTCVVMYHTVRLLLAGRESFFLLLFPFATALLFVVHPIHTEVVANIKSCDEILALLFGLVALCAAIKAVDTGWVHWSVWAGLAFLAACLSKENATTFVVVIPLAVWWFRKKSDLPEKISNTIDSGYRNSVIAIFGAFLLFLCIRCAILGWSFGAAPPELLNNPYLKLVNNTWIPFTFSEKLATIFYSLGQYIYLLIFPHPLTHDYYPNHVALTTWSHPMAILSLLVHIGLALYAILGRYQRDTARFGILFYLITLSIVSNIAFPIGTHLGERFVFIPSLGFCMIVAAGVVYASKKGTQLTLALSILGIITVLYATKTTLRNPVWASNERLFLTDVKTSANSAKANNAAAGVLLNQALKEQNTPKKQSLFQQCMVHADKAIAVYPDFSDAYAIRARARYFLNQYDASITDYRNAIRLAADRPEHKKNLAMALRDAGQFYGEQKNDLLMANQYLNESWQLFDKDPETAWLLGVVSLMQQNYPKAINWYSKALELSPENPTYLFDLGTACINAGDQVRGTSLQQQALKINPKLLEARQ